MSRDKIKKLLAGMDKNSYRYKRTIAYRKPVERLGVKKRSIFNPKEKYDYGLEHDMEIYSGICPCSVCGHEFMWECEDEDCACCSSSCT